MNTDRPTSVNVSLASEEQLDEVRAVFDKALTRLFRDMSSERAQGLITNREALSSVVKSIDFPLVVSKVVFEIDHNIPLERTLSEELMKAIELKDVHTKLDLCFNHHRNTTVAVIKIFQDGIFANLIDKIHSIGFNTGCLRSVLYSMHLSTVGQWASDIKIICPYQMSGKAFLYFVLERVDGKFYRYRLSMKSFPANEPFQLSNHLFVGVKSAN